MKTNDAINTIHTNCKKIQMDKDDKGKIKESTTDTLKLNMTPTPLSGCQNVLINQNTFSKDF